MAVAACGQGAADADDTSTPGDCSAPTFASPELETQVRIALSVRENDASLRERPLTAGLTTLSTSFDVNVSSLDGLECFTSLELLSIGAGTFDSLEPLRGLESLTWIALYRSAVVDLSPIADLPHLSSLFVYEAQISDLSPLASQSLVELGFSGNPIQNLEGLSAVDSSRGDGPGCSYFLYLRNTEVTDSDVNPFCERGWYVTWGSVSDASSCNFDRWESNGCIPATR